MQYADMIIDAFDLAPQPNADPNAISFQIRVLSSPAGELSTVGAVARAYDRKALQEQVRQIEARAMTKDDLITFGRQLADWLLPQAPDGAVGVRDLYQRSLEQAGQDGGLRLRLQLAPALAWIPWEYVYLDLLGSGAQPSGMAGFLALNPRIAIVRHEPMPLAVPKVQPPADAALRVVGALALQAAAQQLDLKGEQAVLEQIFSVKGVEHQFLEQSTLHDLLEHSADAHILHFAGHGEFRTTMGDQPRTFIGSGTVQLADVAIDAEQLGMNVRGNALRLVLLGACESGKRGGVNVINPWDAIVPTLTRFGIPAVIANQFTIQDHCAIEFSRAFYSALFGGMSIERAIVAGRLAIYNADTDGREWGVPVLYMRAADGRLFNGVADSATRRQARAAAENVIQQHIEGVQAGGSAAVVNASGGGDVTVDNSTTVFNISGATESELIPRPRLVPPHYVERTKLEEQLRAALLAASNTAPVVILWGSDGVGKGALAARVATQLFEEKTFTGGVPWSDYAERTTDELLRDLVSSLGRRWAKDGAQLWPTLNERRLPTLVVVDNVRAAKQLKQLLPSELTLPTNSRLLLISDYKIDGNDSVISKQITAGAFEPEQTVQLFANILRQDVVKKYRADLAAIGEFYNHLPPLISSAAQRIAESRLNPGVFLRQLQERESQHDAIGEELLEARELLIHDLTPQQMELFAVTSLFGQGNWSAEMLASVALRPLQDVREALNVLAQRELLAAEDDGRYRVQTLFRETAQRRFEARTPYERGAAWRLFARWCLDRAQDVAEYLRSANLRPADQLGEAEADFYREFRDALRPEMPHIRKVLEWAVDQAAWDILERFAKLSYTELVRRLIWNYPIGYIKLQLVTIEQFFIGAQNPDQPSLQEFLPNDGLLGYAGADDKPRFEPSHKDAIAKIKPLLQRSTSYKAEILCSITAGTIADGVVSGVDLVNGKWSGVQATAIVWDDVHMVGARLVACNMLLGVWKDCDASRALLAGSNLSYSLLKQVRLRGADLRDVDLSGAVLDGVDLRDADLRGANLSGAYLRRVNLLNAKLDQVVWAGAADDGVVLDELARDTFKAAAAVLPSAPATPIYTGALADRDHLEPEWFEGDYSGGDLRGVNGAKVRFGRAMLDGSDFRAARLEQALFRGTQLPDTTLSAAHLDWAQLVRANLRKANLSAASMPFACISGTELIEADFRSARMDGCFVFKSDASRADMYAASLSGAFFYAAKLSLADLRYANLGATQMLYVDLSGALISEQQLKSLYSLRGSVMPSGLLYRGQFALEGDLDEARALGIDPDDAEQMWRFYEAAPAADVPEARALQRLKLHLPESVHPAVDAIGEQIPHLTDPAFRASAPPATLLAACVELQQLLDQLRPIAQASAMWTCIETIPMLVIEELRAQVAQVMFPALEQQFLARSPAANEATIAIAALQKIQNEIAAGISANKNTLQRHFKALAKSPELLRALVFYLVHPIVNLAPNIQDLALTALFTLVAGSIEQHDAPRKTKRGAAAMLQQISAFRYTTETQDVLASQLLEQAHKTPGALDLLEQVFAFDAANWIADTIAMTRAQLPDQAEL